MSSPKSSDWQQGVTLIPQEEWDTIVVGAGPAGSAAALTLARAGRRVLMLDRFRFPRDKACGDALIPDAVRCLDRMGLSEGVRDLAQESKVARAYSPSRYGFDIAGDFLVVPRYALDEYLARSAHRAGAVVGHGTVTGLKEDSEGVEVSVRGHSKALRGRTMIIATGADTRLLEKLMPEASGPPSAYALRAYYRSREKVPHLLFSFDRSVIPGYAWIFPTRLGEVNEYNIGVGVFLHGELAPEQNLRSLLEDFFTSFPDAKRIRDSGESISEVRGARLRCGLNPASARPGERTLAAGETVDTTFPFSGEGIGKAMETAIAAAESVDRFLSSGSSDDLAAYPAYLRDTLKAKYSGYEVAERWLSYEWLNDFIARRAQNSEFLRETASGILSEVLDPREFFSLKGVWRSIWR